MLDTYRETKTYPLGADEVFALCLDAARDIGAEIEGHDAHLGILDADYRPRAGLLFSGRVHIHVAVACTGKGRSEVTVEAYAAYPAHSRWRPVGKPREVAERFISRVGDAVCLAESEPADTAPAAGQPTP